MGKTKLAVLLSGGGTTFQHIVDRIEDGSLANAEIALVISSRPDAGGLARAAKHDIPALVVNRSEFDEKFGGGAVEKFGEEMLRALAEHDIGLVVLAGFMSLLSPAFIEKFRGRIMNTHPALIPSFCGEKMYGHHVHQAAVDYGVKISGCTIHFVDECYDQGAIIMQEPVPVLDSDSADDLAARVQAAEKPLYVKAIRLFCEGRLEIRGRKVFIKDPL